MEVRIAKMGSPQLLVMYPIHHQLAKGTKTEKVIIALMSYGLSSNTQLLSLTGGEGETEGVIYPLSPRRTRAEPQLRSPVLSDSCAGGSE